MKNFHRDSRSGRPGGGKRQDFGGSSGSRPGMHQAICSECGKECEVPFRPTGDRPVFCTACFEKHGNKNSAKPQRQNYQRSGFGNKQMFEAICDKCGNKCEVPFQPTSGKPVYCSQCFDKGSNASAKTPDQSKQQFEILNSKLDKILNALTLAVSAPTPKEAKPEKKAKDKKTPAKPAAKKAKPKRKK